MSTSKAARQRSKPTSCRFTLRDLGAHDDYFELIESEFVPSAQAGFDNAVASFLSEYPVDVEVGSPFQELLAAHRNLCEHFAEWSAKETLRESFGIAPSN